MTSGKIEIKAIALVPTTLWFESRTWGQPEPSRPSLLNDLCNSSKINLTAGKVTGLRSNTISSIRTRFQWSFTEYSSWSCKFPTPKSSHVLQTLLPIVLRNEFQLLLLVIFIYLLCCWSYSWVVWLLIWCYFNINWSTWPPWLAFAFVVPVCFIYIYIYTCISFNS